MRRAVTALSPGLVHALNTYVPEGATVFSDLDTSYRIGAYAPVYVVAAPPGHVADTHENRPYARRGDVEQFFRTGDYRMTSRYGGRLARREQQALAAGDRQAARLGGRAIAPLPSVVA